MAQNFSQEVITFEWSKSCLAAMFIWYITSKYQVYSNKKCGKSVLQSFFKVYFLMKSKP